MKRTLTLAVIVLVLAATSPLVAQMRGLGRFNGTVVDESGQPIPGVAIRASIADDAAIETKSDEKGDWAVAGVAKGSWRVVFQKTGYSPVAARVTLEAELARVPPIKVTLKKN